MKRRPPLPRQAWTQIIKRTLFFTGFGIVVSVVGSHFLLSTFSGGLDLVGTAAAIIIPVCLGGPMTLFLSIRNHELEHAYRQLEASAERDSLTQCLNHGAFVSRAKAYLNAANDHAVFGGLLVVDADMFKSINDRFGHDVGDTALRQIAASIRGAARNGDTVGRIGGEEFGVFLPGASRETIEAVAEAIRRGVQAISLEAEGIQCRLSVSIGGAVFEHRIGYSELFRAADRLLYGVKDSGRNAVGIVAVTEQAAFAKAS